MFKQLKHTIATHQFFVTFCVIVGLFAAVIAARETQLIQKRANENLQCPENSAFCQWDPINESGITYRYRISDLTTLQVVKEGDTSERRVSFTPLPSHTYRCEVIPINACGSGPLMQAEKACESSPANGPSNVIISSPTESPSNQGTVGQGENLPAETEGTSSSGKSIIAGWTLVGAYIFFAGFIGVVGYLVYKKIMKKPKIHE